MPAFHNWAYGGGRTRNEGDDGYDMLPQSELHKDAPMDPDRRKMAPGHCMTTAFNPDDKENCSTDGWQRGKPEQGTYLSCTNVEVGDVFGMVLMPKFTLVHGFFWRIRKPLAGLTVRLGLRGCAKSLNPPIDNPDFDAAQPEGPDNAPLIDNQVLPEAIRIPFGEIIDLGQGFDANGCLFDDCYYPNDYVGAPIQPVTETNPRGHIYLDQNDMFSMEIVTVPADFTPKDLMCLDFEIAPHIDWFCKGGAGYSKADLYTPQGQPHARIV